MTEQEIIEQLNALRLKHVNNPIAPKVPGAKSVYFGGPWFNDTQAELMISAYEALLMNPTVSHIHVPLLNQYKGMVLSGGDSKLSPQDQHEWAEKTFKADVTAMENSDVMTMLNTGGHEDSGTDWEAGAMYMAHRPVVGIFKGDLNETPVNLMPAMGVSSYVTDEKELATFNFLSIPMRKYEGKII